jgi:hypothetical protein
MQTDSGRPCSKPAPGPPHARASWRPVSRLGVNAIALSPPISLSLSLLEQVMNEAAVKLRRQAGWPSRRCAQDGPYPPSCTPTNTLEAVDLPRMVATRLLGAKKPTAKSCSRPMPHGAPRRQASATTSASKRLPVAPPHRRPRYSSRCSDASTAAASAPCGCARRTWLASPKSARPLLAL